MLTHAELPPLVTREGDPIYRLAYIDREVRREYPDTIDYIGRFLHRPAMWGTSVLLVDATGVGLPVVQQMRRDQRIRDAMQRGRLQLIPIVITPGEKLTKANGALHVPKRHLVDTVQAILGKRRLRVAPGPHKTTLEHELREFRAKISSGAKAGASISFNAREGAHDDVVLATALTLYAAEVFRSYRWKLQAVTFLEGAQP